MRNKCVREKKGHIKLTFTTLVEGVAFWQQLLVWGYSAVPRGQIHFIRAAPHVFIIQGKASISQIHQDIQHTCLGVLDFFVSTCISDSLLRARACFICCWIILKFSHCMIYPNSGRTRWLTFPKQQMGKVWMFKITKRRVWSHYNKPSNKPRIENKE